MKTTVKRNDGCTCDNTAPLHSYLYAPEFQRNERCTCGNTAPPHPDCPFKGFNDAVMHAMRYLSLAETIIRHECEVGTAKLAFSKKEPIFLLGQQHYYHLVNCIARAGYCCEAAEHIYHERIVFYEKDIEADPKSMECCECESYLSCELYSRIAMSDALEILMGEKRDARKLGERLNKEIRGVTPEEMKIVDECMGDWDTACMVIKAQRKADDEANSTK